MRVEPAGGDARAPSGPGGTAASPALGRVGHGAAGRAASASSSRTPLASSRSYGRAGAVPGGRLGRAHEREPEPPPLARLVAGPGVALADLEHGDVVGAVAQVARPRRRAGCRAGCGAAPSGRATAGCPRRSGRRRARARRRPTGPRAASTNVSTWRGDTSAVVTTSVRPAPASVSRTSSRTSSGDGRNCGHRGVRRDRRHELVAADPGDLLRDVRLDRDVAAPRRARSRDSVRPRRPRRRAARARARRRPGRRRRPARSRRPRARAAPAARRR